jgi:hypothetical protein
LASSLQRRAVPDARATDLQILDLEAADRRLADRQLPDGEPADAQPPDRKAPDRRSTYSQRPDRHRTPSLGTGSGERAGPLPKESDPMTPTHQPQRYR